MEVGKTLYYGQFGSHIFGTNVPESDLDFKGIFVPSTENILLQEASKTSINQNTNKNNHAKNTSKDKDIELFTAQGFIRLCEEGQTVALDMLFTPRSFWITSSPEWEFIIKHRSKLIHKGVSAFVGYCQTQAAKYSIKGTRIASLRKALSFLKTLPKQDKLSQHLDLVQSFVQSNKIDKYSSLKKNGEKEYFIEIVQCKGPNSQMIDHLCINNRKLPIFSRAKHCEEVLQKILDGYGKRAKKAENNNGIDWKALMHAVRVFQEAKELLTTHQITFPRPEKDLLLKIRKGEIPYKEVALLIEEGLQDVNNCLEKSTLPLSIDKEFWRHWLLSLHLSHVVKGSKSIDPTLCLNL